MRQIGLVGPVDKRIIAYPLFKICDVLGKVLVVTDDANFRRFSEDYSNDFTVGRSDFIITSDISKTIIDEIGVKFSSYDYVLFITTDKVMPDNDCTVYCHGNNQLICSDDTLDTLNAIEFSEVTISTTKPIDKNATFCAIDSKTLSYIWDCEENKYFLPCKNTELVKLCSFLFSQVLNISKEDFAQSIVKEI